MRKLLSVLLLLSAIVLPVSATTAKPKIDPVDTVNYHELLQKATLALYQRWPTGDAKQPFISQFICTATVVGGNPGEYMLLTAGHCISDNLRPGTQYFISETISDDPVLQSVRVLKHASTKRYDYALLSLHSPRAYPSIDVDIEDVPAIETKVFNVNFGLGLTKQFTSGIVGSKVMTREESSHSCSNCAGRYMAEFGIAPGASGSAIVDESTHKIVGLVEAIFLGLANGTIVEPMGKNFDDFLIDDSVNQVPLPSVAVPKIEPEDESFTKLISKNWKSASEHERYFLKLWLFLAGAFLALLVLKIWLSR